MRGNFTLRSRRRIFVQGEYFAWYREFSFSIGIKALEITPIGCHFGRYLAPFFERYVAPGILPITCILSCVCVPWAKREFRERSGIGCVEVQKHLILECHPYPARYEFVSAVWFASGARPVSAWRTNGVTHATISSRSMSAIAGLMST